MISYKAREKIRNEFVDFNKRYNTKVYPTTKAIQNTENKLDGVVQQYNRLPMTVTPFKPEKEEVLQKEVYYSGKKKLIVDRGEILNLDVDVDLCVYCIAKKNINPFLLLIIISSTPLTLDTIAGTPRAIDSKRALDIPSDFDADK